MEAHERYVFYNPLPECWADGHLPERCCPDSNGRNGYSDRFRRDPDSNGIPNAANNADDRFRWDPDSDGIPNARCFDTEHRWQQCCGSQARFLQWKTTITSSQQHKNFTWAPDDKINLIPIPHFDNKNQSAVLFAPMFASILNRRFDSSASRASRPREASPLDSPVPTTENRVIAEIGVLRGEFSATLLQYLKFPLEYYCIDPWNKVMALPMLPWSETDLMKDNLVKAIGNVAPYWDRIHIVQMPAMKALRLFEDESISFLFIDGDHSKRAVEEEMARYWPKISPGGIMAGHDYANPGFLGVKLAVDAFGKRINQRPKLLSFLWSEHCWYFTKQQ